MQPSKRDSIIEIDPFQLARDLLEDNKGDISECDYNYILGSIRSRSHQNMSNLFRSLGPDLRGTHEARLLSQITALFKKNADFGSDKARIDATWELFLASEAQCRITNRKFDFYGLYPSRLKAERNIQLKSMQTVIRRVLGSVSDFYDALPGLVRVTDGASASASRSFATPERKVAKRRGWCYPGCVPLVTTLASYFGADISPKPTNFNTIGMVPKQWDKNRLIAAEAEWALPIQLAIDSFLKDRLKKTLGIDLTNQTINQELAMRGSITGDVGTIDLSAASDTISRSLVEYLLPREWFALLSSLRAPFWSLKKEGKRNAELTGTYAKFSSMGNGVTFCLETLIFYACAHACGASVLAVYGDDICVDNASYDSTVNLLRFCGFKTNEAKSYNVGPFRESCGVDCHSGVNIRPFYLRSNSLDRKGLANMVNGMGVYRTGERVSVYLAEMVRKHRLPLIPTCDDKTAGVFVSEGYQQRHPHSEGRPTWIMESRILTRKARASPAACSRHYALWLFKNRAQVERYKETAFQTRRTTLTSVVLKWSGVIKRPNAPELYLWTSILLNYLKGGVA